MNFQGDSKNARFDRKRSFKNSIKTLLKKEKGELEKKRVFFKMGRGKENQQIQANKLPKNPKAKRSKSRFKVRRYSVLNPVPKSKVDNLNLFRKKFSVDNSKNQMAERKNFSSTLFENYKKIKSLQDCDPHKQFINVYAANTHNGRCRNYNEDRVAIILNIVSKSVSFFDEKEESRKVGKRDFISLKEIKSLKDIRCIPKRVSFFGLYDGHAGASCADYLKENLHNFLTQSIHFKSDKSKALFEGIIEAENEFKARAVEVQGSRTSKGHKMKIVDNSGSCALACLFDGNKGYVANVGDSRLILSRCKGTVTKQVSNDHKPESEDERERILKYGGAITRKQSLMRVKQIDEDGKVVEVDKTLEGPCRVNPGGLSVSRTIGDFHSKLTEFGGNPMCVIPIPELTSFTIGKNDDFMVMACDGVFDVLTNEEVNAAIWDVLAKGGKNDKLEDLAELATDKVIQLAIQKESTDNLTVVIVFFKERDYYL